MKNILFTPQWSWKTSGLALGLIFFLAVAFVKPIGVSTQFVILDGLLWKSVSKELVKPDSTAKKGYSSSNAYLNKSGGKYAKSVAQPANYSFIFVFAMVAGGFLAKILQPKETAPQNHSQWKLRIGDTSWKRFLVAFIGGFLVLIGARLAGGCTSGHMMSGMMQTSLSGYLFALGAFVVAIPVSFLMFKGEK
jgi:hypothetical protein